MVLPVKVVGESENRLDRWLAYDGASNRTRVVLYRRVFGRVMELWMMDLGLGPIHGIFQVVSEEEYDFMQMEANEVQMQGAQVVEISDEESDGDEAGMVNAKVEEQMMMVGVEMEGMGQRG